MDKLNVEAWVGREVLDRGGMTEFQAAHVHSTLGEGDAPVDGDPLPPLWHWCAFPNAAPNERLNEDGHIGGSALLPPVRLPRRMWAGGSLSFHRPLHIGETLQRRTRIGAVTEKMGKTGPMVLVTLYHQISGEAGLAIEERQDIVYLEIPETFSPPAKRSLPAEVSESVPCPGPVLFRFSAITFNAHRIHYDLPYTQEVERYPDLIVHGPLQAMLLMRAAVRKAGRTPAFFDFRSVHPMFASSPCDLAMAEDGEGLALWSGQDGHQCMTAQAVWEGTV